MSTVRLDREVYPGISAPSGFADALNGVAGKAAHRSRHSVS